MQRPARTYPFPGSILVELTLSYGILLLMRYGVVRKLSFDRGFGFIQQDRGSDVYFHATAVVDNAFNRIGPDQPVKYELEPRKEGEEPGKLRAAKVELIDRIPGGILQDAATVMAKHHPKARQRKPTWRTKPVVSPEDSPPASELPPDGNADGPAGANVV
jgi:CspA family cold shock protein